VSKGEIPDTEQGVRNYLRYCKIQIDVNKRNIEKLKTRIGWCMDKLDKFKGATNGKS